MSVTGSHRSPLPSASTTAATADTNLNVNGGRALTNSLTIQLSLTLTITLTLTLSGGGAVSELNRVNKNLSLILGSGLYNDESDPLVQELMKTVKTS